MPQLPERVQQCLREFRERFGETPEPQLWEVAAALTETFASLWFATPLDDNAREFCRGRLAASLAFHWNKWHDEEPGIPLETVVERIRGGRLAGKPGRVQCDLLEEVVLTEAACCKEERASKVIVELVERIKRDQHDLRARQQLDELPSKLFIPTQDGKLRLRGFMGQSCLESWLRVVVRRESGQEARKRIQGSDPLGGYEEPADPGPSPLVTARVNEGSEIRRCMELLTDFYVIVHDRFTRDQITMWKMATFDGLTQAEVAKLFERHRGRVNRIIHSIDHFIKSIIANDPRLPPCLHSLNTLPKQFRFDLVDHLREMIKPG